MKRRQYPADQPAMSGLSALHPFSPSAALQVSLETSRHPKRADVRSRATLHSL